MKKGGFPFLAFSLFLCHSAVAETSTIESKVSAETQAFVMFGHGAIVHFDLARDKHLEKALGCAEGIILEASVSNPRENFDKTEAESSLKWSPVCLRCEAKVRVAEGFLLEDATLTGEELKGSYIHYLMQKPPDRFGFQISKGAKATLTGKVSLTKTPCYKRLEESVPERN